MTASQVQVADLTNWPGCLTMWLHSIQTGLDNKAPSLPTELLHTVPCKTRPHLHSYRCQRDYLILSVSTVTFAIGASLRMQYTSGPGPMPDLMLPRLVYFTGSDISITSFSHSWGTILKLFSSLIPLHLSENYPIL